jgi:DNA-binding GntR family transcriptional regulator
MENQPLKDIVYKSLRYDILTGKILGGTHITESSIAKRLDVSRTPVREALQRLTQEKLVISLPRAGYIVEDMSDEDIQDLFSARFEIESLVIKRAVKYITDNELSMMKQNIDIAKACIQSGELQKMTELDLEFHAMIYKASRSKTLFRICQNLGELTMKYRHGLNLVRDLWEKIIENHTSIYEALAAKNEDKAVKTIVSHGEQARYQLLDIMKKVRSDSFFMDGI